MRINDYLNDDELKELQDLLMIVREMGMLNWHTKTPQGLTATSVNEDLGWIADRINELERISADRFVKRLVMR